MFDAICPAVYQQLRKRTGLSQAELADALGVHRNTVVRFESGNSHPSQAQMETLLKRAKCSREEFVELICEKMSELIDKRVGIHEGQVGFVPVTAIMIAYTLRPLHQRFANGGGFCTNGSPTVHESSEDPRAAEAMRNHRDTFSSHPQSAHPHTGINPRATRVKPAKADYGIRPGARRLQPASAGFGFPSVARGFIPVRQPACRCA